MVLLQRSRRRLGAAQNTEQVATENFSDRLIGIAAIEQPLGDAWVGGNVFESDRGGVDTVEVGPDSDVVDTGDLDDVVDMIEYLTEAAAWQRSAMLSSIGRISKGP